MCSAYLGVVMASTAIDMASTAYYSILTSTCEACWEKFHYSNFICVYSGLTDTQGDNPCAWVLPPVLALFNLNISTFS